MEHFTLMNNDLQKKRMFLFLQGPHGPFFSQLACALESYGHVTSQIGFNKGDKIFWANKRNFIAFTLPIHAWSGFLQRQFRDKRITDLVIYNDTRPFHKTAIQAAHAKGINVHIFEEGYLRPYWITYERDGSNGNSKLMSLAQSAVVPDHLTRDTDPVPAPCHWGDMREHIFYGAVHHWCILCANRQFPNFTSHREISIRKEFRLHLKQLVFTPARIAARFWANLTLKCGTFPYHLILMQLQHDSAFQNERQFSRTHPAKFCKQRPAPSTSCDQSTPFGRWSLRNRVSFAPTRYKIRHQQAHSLSSRRQARACLRSSTQRCDCQFNRWPTSFMARHSSENTGKSDLQSQ